MTARSGPYLAGRCRTYGYCGRRLLANFQIEELALTRPGPSGPPGLYVELAQPPRLQSSLAADGLVAWDTQGVPVAQGRSGDRVLIRYTGVADFLIAAREGHVWIHPTTGASIAVVTHFLLNQVLPRLLGALEPLVVHASGVTTEHGAIAFLGSSGSGKSTLAAGYVLASKGRLLADDALILRPSRTHVEAVGPYPLSRLRADSFEGLEPRTTAHEARSTGGKQVLSLPHCLDDPHPPFLKCFFVLEPGASIEIVPLSGSDALMSLISNSFLLEPSSPGMLGRQFESASAVLDTGVMGMRLSYPRDYKRMKELVHSMGLAFSKCATSRGANAPGRNPSFEP